MQPELKLHKKYSRDEIAKIFGEKNGQDGKWVSGVVPVGDNSVALFITLNKRPFARRHQYRDGFESTKILRWQSQNKTRPDKGMGVKHIEETPDTTPHHVFVRTEKGESFIYCGKVKYNSHKGSKPITIWWELLDPLPKELYKKFKKATRK